MQSSWFTRRDGFDSSASARLQNQGVSFSSSGDLLLQMLQLYSAKENFTGLANPDAQTSHAFISTIAEIVCAACSNNPISLLWSCRSLPCLHLKYAINLAQVHDTFVVLVRPRKGPCVAIAESQGAAAMTFHVRPIDPPAVVGFAKWFDKQTRNSPLQSILSAATGTKHRLVADLINCLHVTPLEPKILKP